MGQPVIVAIITVRALVKYNTPTALRENSKAAGMPLCVFYSSVSHASVVSIDPVPLPPWVTVTDNHNSRLSAYRMIIEEE